MAKNGEKSSETYERVADFFQSRGDKDWARASNNSNESYKYGSARDNYDSADKARNSANKSK